MDREWFIWMSGKQEGPYTILDLKRDPRITPDTLAWKKGLEDWTAIRYLPELKDIFKDEPQGKSLHEEPNLKPFSTELPEQEALTLQNDPSQFLLWLIIAFLILCYIFYQIQKFSW